MPLDEDQPSRRQEPAGPHALLLTVSAYAACLVAACWLGWTWYGSAESTPQNEETPVESASPSDSSMATQRSDLASESSVGQPSPAMPADVAGTGSAASSEVRILYRCRLRYPAIAVRERHEGKVIVKVRIGTEGKATLAEVYRASGFEELDQAALTNTRCFTFKPRTREGRPVESLAFLPFDFKLH